MLVCICRRVFLVYFFQKIWKSRARTNSLTDIFDLNFIDFFNFYLSFFEIQDVLCFRFSFLSDLSFHVFISSKAAANKFLFSRVNQCRAKNLISTCWFFKYVNRNFLFFNLKISRITHLWRQFVPIEIGISRLKIEQTVIFQNCVIFLIYWKLHKTLYLF